jgi:hypothetical protein
MAGDRRSVACLLLKPAFHRRVGQEPIGETSRRTLAAATYALQLFVERLVEFFLLPFGIRLLIGRHISCFR